MKNTLAITAIILLAAAVMYYAPPKNQEPVTLGYHEAPQWMKEEEKRCQQKP